MQRYVLTTDHLRDSANPEIQHLVRDNFVLQDTLDTSADYAEFKKDLNRLGQNLNSSSRYEHAKRGMKFNVFGHEFECKKTDTVEQVIKRVVDFYLQEQRTEEEAKEACDAVFRNWCQYYLGFMQTVLNRGLIEKAMQTNNSYVGSGIESEIMIYLPEQLIEVREKDFTVEFAGKRPELVARIKNDSCATFQVSPEHGKSCLLSIETSTPLMCDAVLERTVPEFSNKYRNQFTAGPAIATYNVHTYPVEHPANVSRLRRIIGFGLGAPASLGVAFGIAVLVAPIPVVGQILAPIILFAGVVSCLLCIKQAKQIQNSPRVIANVPEKPVKTIQTKKPELENETHSTVHRKLSAEKPRQPSIAQTVTVVAAPSLQSENSEVSKVDTSADPQREFTPRTPSSRS